MLADGGAASLRSHDRATSCIRSTTTGSSPATAPRGSRSSRICRTSTRSSRRSAAAGCWPASARPCARCKPGVKVLRRGTGNRSAAGDVAGPRRSQLFRRLDRRRSSTAPAARSVLPTMWPLLEDAGRRVDCRDARRGACRRCGAPPSACTSLPKGPRRAPWRPRSAAAPAAARLSPSSRAATSTSRGLHRSSTPARSR